MILDLYISLFVFAFAFLFYGYYTNNDIYRIIGSFLIIVLAAMLVPQINSVAGALEYVNGAKETVAGNITTIENTYATFTSPVLGFYLFLAGAMSFYLVLMDRRKSKDD